jgi:hypothetical protein
MPRRRLPAVLIAAGALLLGGFGLASCGADDEVGTTESTRTQPTLPTTTDTTTTTTQTTTEVERPTVLRVRVVGGVPKSGIVRKTVDKGDRVVIVVTSDVADEVHLHGYDIMSNVAAGGSARLRFRATLPGRFEVELEDRGVQIADLTVQP